MKQFSRGSFLLPREHAENHDLIIFPVLGVSDTKLSWFSLLHFAVKNMSLLNNLNHHLFTVLFIEKRLSCGQLSTTIYIGGSGSAALVSALATRTLLTLYTTFSEGAWTFDHEPSRSSDVD